MFNIGKNTGELVLENALDYETTKEYLLLVVALDQGYEPNSASATVRIIVEDVNDNAPLIKLHPLLPMNRSSFALKTPSKFQVLENTSTVQAVAHVSVSDADSGANAKVDCHLSSPFFYLDQLYNNEYKLLSLEGADFDRETIDHYNLRISCADQGSPFQMTSSVQLTIVVADLNDNQPIFSQSFYHFKTYENTQTGTKIGSISALDNDKDENRRISYSIQNSLVKRTFEINVNTGSIVLKEGLDREKVDKYEFTVKARDHGIPFRASSVNVTIEVHTSFNHLIIKNALSHEFCFFYFFFI